MAKCKKNQLESKPKESRDLVKEFDEYTAGERSRIASWAVRYERKPVKYKKVKDSSGSITVSVQEADALLGLAQLTEAYGTADPELQNLFLNQVVQSFEGCLSSEGFNYERLLDLSNQAVAILQGIAPKDEIEGMLAIQMIGVHNLAMQTIKQAMITNQTLEGRQVNVNHATKMLRTYVAQMEALKKYRSGGQQKVTVKHVHVNEGGRAIVGSVNRGGGGDNIKKSG